MATGYGLDISCTNSPQFGRLVRGRELVAQAAYRRLITPRGTLSGGPEELAYGIDLAGYVGSIGYDTAIRTLDAVIRNELIKDQRVQDARVAVTRAEKGGKLIGLTVEITLSLYDESEDVTLTLAVSDVTVELLGIV